MIHYRPEACSHYSNIGCRQDHPSWQGRWQGSSVTIEACTAQQFCCGGSAQELEANSAAESHKAAGQSSGLRSPAHTAMAPVTTPLAPHAHAQPVTQQQATPYCHAQAVTQPQAPASKVATAATSTASDHLTTSAAAKPYTGAAAVTSHSTPAQFPHLFQQCHQ